MKRNRDTEAVAIALMGCLIMLLIVGAGMES